MNDLITPDEFAEILAETAKQYTDEIVEKVEGGIDKIAKETRKEVKTLSPEKSGKYKKGWTVTVKQERGLYRATVHNKQYQLVHLLELGHLNRDGTTRSRAFPHVETAEKNADKKLDELINKL